MNIAYLYKYTTLSYLFMLICQTANSQQQIESIANTFQEQASNLPTELIYLQTSKGIYETGEDLWFKAYQFDAQSFGLSDKSKTLYLQMINSKDSVVWQEKYLIENGIAPGHIYIDDKLAEGDYLLEGYTRHSFYQNDTTTMVASRKIKVVKNIARTEIIGNPKDEEFRFTTFPEGGNLVYGIPSRLAFKATDGKGNPISITGALYQDDEPITDIKSTHDGMGSILFAPLKSHIYRIELTNGKSYNLPEIESEGVVLRLVKQDNEQLNFIISQSKELPNRQIYLMGQMRGAVCCIATGILKDNLSIKIPTKNFIYQGIAEFTIFNAEMQPIAERLVYLNPEKKLTITAEPDKPSYKLRDKAVVKIKVTDQAGNPVRANLGVTVFDQAYDNPTDPTTILTNCYLSSQIKGKIYNPSYYFNQENSNRAAALDLLLLTQGWRRYTWSTATTPTPESIFLTDEVTATQTIGSKKKGKDYQESEQLIQVSGQDGNPQFIWGNSAGEFSINPDIMKLLIGSYLYLKPMLSTDFKPKLHITDYFTKIDSIRRLNPNYYPIADMTMYKKEPIFDLPLISNDSTMMVEEVTVQGRGHNPFRDKFMGKLDSLAQISLGPWVCECRPGYLNDYISGYTHHIYHTDSYKGKRLLPVNGKTYRLVKYVTKEDGKIYVEDVKDIVYNGPVYTEEELLRMNNLWRTKGYYAVREFYQPDEIAIQISTPDARNTLLWAPSVVTDEKGEATVSFYCSDINTRFIGRIEGTDGTGLLGAAECEFRVTRNTQTH